MSPLPHVGYVLTVFPRLSETFVLNEVMALERLGLPITIFSQKPAAGEGPSVSLETRASHLVLDAHCLRTQGATLRDHGWLLATRPRRYLNLLRWALGRGNQATRKRFWRAGRLARECERRGIDHLHAHFLSGNTRLARMAAELAGVSYSLTAHAKDIYAAGLSRSKIRRRVEGAAFAVTVSEHNRAHLAAVADPDRLVVIRNGVDVERIPFRSAIHRNGGARRILAVGRLVPKKGFDVLIEAVAELRAQGRGDVEAWIVGEGPEEARLSSLIAERELGDRVELLGARPHAEVLALMTRASLLSVPSVIAADGDRDGLPTVIPEAMAAGLPVVAARTVGIPELVIDGETGLLAEPGNPAGLARALGNLLDDPARAAALARAARAKIEAEYDLKRNVARLCKRFAAVPRRASSSSRASVLQRAEVA
jgi:glycosyltransferase involved in cell wall biosynthesis